MSFGELMGLLIFMSGLVAIFAVLGSSYRHRLAHKLRLAELKAAVPQGALHAQVALNESHADLVERLEHRIRVLERIATDAPQPGLLAAEIESLRGR